MADSLLGFIRQSAANVPIPDWLSSTPKTAQATLSNANMFPEAIGTKIGGAGDYIHAMVKNGADPVDIEEFLRQYQFGNLMPGVRESLGKIIPKGISTGAVLPPFLSDIMQAGVNQKNQGMGGA